MWSEGHVFQANAEAGDGGGIVGGVRQGISAARLLSFQLIDRA
jgi:hypothetical protein